MLAGKPLCAWMIDAARASRLIDRLVVVSDDAEAKSFAQAIGLTCYSVAAPKDGGMDRFAEIALVAQKELPDFDYIVVLDSASPLVLSSDIDGVIEVSARNDGTPVVTVSETRLTLPSLVVLDGARKMQKVFGNQDPVPANTRIYTTNNSIAVSATSYVKTHGTFLTEDTHAYITPSERTLVVESKADLVVAEGFLKLTGPNSINVAFNQDAAQSRV